MIRKFNVICQVDIEVEVDDSDITEDESIEDIAINLAGNEILDISCSYLVQDIQEI